MSTLKIKDGRDKFYTFDTNRVLIIDDDDGTINHIDFETDGSKADPVEVEVASDGTRYVTIPNKFFNGDYSRIVAFYMVTDSDGQYTLKKQIFRITYRQEIEGYELEYTNMLTLASVKEVTEYYRNEARKWANGTDENGNPISSGTQYNNNAKYYYEASKDWAVKETAVQNGLKSAKTYSEIAKDWATKTTGHVEGTDDSAKKISQDLHTYVGSENDAITETSVYGIINKKKQDIIDHVGINPADDDETSKTTIDNYVSNTVKPSINTYAMGDGNTSLKSQLNDHVNNNSTGLKKSLSDYESDLESTLNTYTTGTNSNQMFGKLNNYIENTTKPSIDSYVNNTSKSQINNYVNTDSKGKLNDYVRDVSKPAIDDYVDDVVKPAIDDYAEEKVDSYVGDFSDESIDANGTIVQKLNSQSQAIANQIQAASATILGRVSNLKFSLTSEGLIHIEEVTA